MQFCRQILGVQKNTTNHGVLLELGRTPLTFEAQRLSIKNWERIKGGKGNILVGESYQNACAKNLDWHQTINDLLSRHGMMNCVLDPIPNVSKSFIDRTKDIYHQEAFSRIVDPESKLRTYGLIKHEVGREDYLVQIKNPKQRQTLTKFRLSNHKLMIEIGRHMIPKLDKEQRICQICYAGVEDEIHFLTKCKILEPIRKPLFDLCEELRPEFTYYSPKEKFIHGI